MRRQRTGPRAAASGSNGGARARGASRPAPSAESIVLGVLRKAGRPLRLDEVAEAIGLPSDQAEAQLQALVKRGEVVPNRRGQYCLREHLPGLVVGTIQAHRNGDGLLLPDDASAAVHLSGQQMREVMHGDRVAVRIEGAHFRGKAQGTIVEVLERRTREVVGRLQVESGVAYLTPDNPRMTHRVLVPAGALGGAESGQVVIVQLTQQPSRSAQPVGRVTRVLGDHGAPGMEVDIAIHSHSLPFEFPDSVVAEAEAFGRRHPAGRHRWPRRPARP